MYGHPTLYILVEKLDISVNPHCQVWYPTLSYDCDIKVVFFFFKQNRKTWFTVHFPPIYLSFIMHSSLPFYLAGVYKSQLGENLQLSNKQMVLIQKKWGHGCTGLSLQVGD